MSAQVHLFLRGPLSQWHPSRFVIDDVEYNCAEQYMMASKARLFGDTAMAERILATNQAHEQKLMGSQVSGFISTVWNEHREVIVYDANWAKFSQNSGLAKRLLATGQAVLAEANPRDFIWGIGLAEEDPLALNPLAWPGENRLGKVLMRVRDRLGELAS